MYLNSRDNLVMRSAGPIPPAIVTGVGAITDVFGGPLSRVRALQCPPVRLAPGKGVRHAARAFKIDTSVTPYGPRAGIMSWWVPQVVSTLTFTQYDEFWWA